MRGEDLAEEVRQTLNARLTGVRAPYNRTFTTNGIACTTATVIAATLGIRDIALITPEERDRIKDVHLLLAMFNALQPGVFALSGWDLGGMLTVDAADVADLIAEGDTRWLNRGGHDLRGVDEPVDRGPHARRPLRSTGRCRSSSPTRALVRVRPAPHPRRAQPARDRDREADRRAGRVQQGRAGAWSTSCADGTLQITALNFSGEAINGSVRSEHLPGGAQLTDMFTGEDLGTVDDLHSFSLVDRRLLRALAARDAAITFPHSAWLPRITRR